MLEGKTGRGLLCQALHSLEAVPQEREAHTPGLGGSRGSKDRLYLELAICQPGARRHSSTWDASIEPSMSALCPTLCTPHIPFTSGQSEAARFPTLQKRALMVVGRKERTPPCHASPGQVLSFLLQPKWVPLAPSPFNPFLLHHFPLPLDLEM